MISLNCIQIYLNISTIDLTQSLDTLQSIETYFLLSSMLLTMSVCTSSILLLSLSNKSIMISFISSFLNFIVISFDDNIKTLSPSSFVLMNTIKLHISMPRYLANSALHPSVLILICMSIIIIINLLL